MGQLAQADSGSNQVARQGAHPRGALGRSRFVEAPGQVIVPASDRCASNQHLQGSTLPQEG